MRLVETSHLTQWAGMKSAENRFPYWVKQLITAVIQEGNYRFPSDDATWLPGYDGELFTTDDSKFVPKGYSVWEVGTGNRPQSKANADYKKRSQGDLDQDSTINRSEITFVFVTPRVWKGKGKWVTSRKDEKIWKDVIAIDGVDLLEWLETASAVYLQFAAELGRVPESGLQTPKQAWDQWRNYTVPPASVELVIAGREQQEKELLSILSEPQKIVTIRGDSPREAWGFALAVIQRLPKSELHRLHSRMIVANDEKVAQSLQYIKNHIILIKQAIGQVSGILTSNGSNVIISEGNDAHSSGNIIELARSTRQAFSEALTKMGLDDEEADRVTRECGGSVTVFQRLRPAGNYEEPGWVKNLDIVDLLPALLAGRWNHNNKEDRAAICSLAEVDDYDEIVNQLQSFLSVDEPPIQKIQEMWVLTAPVDLFQLIARRLNQGYLDRFEAVFREVFGQIDPRVEMPPKDWLYYDVKGDKGYSAWLRSGMAESLLLIAERGTDAQIICNKPLHEYANGVVAGLPNLNNDWRLLASLRDQYQRLIEAAPSPLLTSLEHLLEAKPEDIRKIFVDEDGLLGGNLHTGLLWGLETIAWSAEYLQRATTCLAKLASLDPGGRLSNRPLNSLREIFLWWHPGTNAQLDQRITAIDLIISIEPEIGWSLLSQLLPESRSSFSHPTPKPRWRDFGDLPEDARNRNSIMKYLSEIIDRAIGQLGADPERWKVILNSIKSMSDSQKEEVINRFAVIAQSDTPPDLKIRLWNTTRDFVNKHRTYRDAQWALSPTVLDRLEELFRNIKPFDPIESNRWLFDEWLPDLPSGEKELEPHKLESDKLRRLAVQEILEREGIKGLVQLGTTCKVPRFVAYFAVEQIKELGTVLALLKQSITNKDTGLQLATEISGQAHEKYDKDWRDLLQNEVKASTWSPAVIASLLTWWPSNATTRIYIESLGKEVKKEYWSQKPIAIIDGDVTDQIYAIDSLIDVGRAATALESVSFNPTGIPSEILLRVFDATIVEISRVETVEEFRRTGIASYHIQQFLDHLRNRTDIPREELARREYQALPLLDSSVTHKLVIYEFMAENPNFFVEVLCSVYLPKHRDKKQDVELTPDEQAKTQSNYMLLRSMKLIPGDRGNGEINQTNLVDWIQIVRAKAKEMDRIEVADSHIGGILAHSPPDQGDNGWPHHVVRNVIEQFASPDIEHGIMIERFNMRGTCSKAMYEGGTQERDIAEQYRSWAEISSVQWPRVARFLKATATAWDHDAKREDNRAEQDKLEH